MNFKVKVVSPAEYATYIAAHPGLDSSGDPDAATDTTGGTTSTTATTTGGGHE